MLTIAQNTCTREREKGRERESKDSGERLMGVYIFI